MSRWMHGFGTAFGICGMPLVLAYVSSCDDAPPIAPTSGDATADAARPSRRDAGSSEDDAFVPPTTSSVPEGWVRYDDYDPACGLYIPSDKKYLPEPVRWEPCTNPVGDAGTPDPQSMVCRRMVTDWPVGSSTGQHTTTWLPTAKTDDGRLLVLLRRLVGDQLYDMVADVDGPVRNALLRAGQCLAIKPVLSKTSFTGSSTLRTSQDRALEAPSAVPSTSFTRVGSTCQRATSRAHSSPIASPQALDSSLRTTVDSVSTRYKQESF